MVCVAHHWLSPALQWPVNELAPSSKSPVQIRSGFDCARAARDGASAANTRRKFLNVPPVLHPTQERQGSLPWPIYGSVRSFGCLSGVHPPFPPGGECLPCAGQQAGEGAGADLFNGGRGRRRSGPQVAGGKARADRLRGDGAVRGATLPL